MGLLTPRTVALAGLRSVGYQVIKRLGNSQAEGLCIDRRRKALPQAVAKDWDQRFDCGPFLDRSGLSQYQRS